MCTILKVIIIKYSSNSPNSTKPSPPACIGLPYRSNDSSRPQMNVFLQWPTTLTAKELTSRQKEKDPSQKEKPHDKKKKDSRAKRITWRQKEKPHDKKEKTRRKTTTTTMIKVKNDHRSKFSNLSNWKEEAWKNQGFNGIRTNNIY